MKITPCFDAIGQLYWLAEARANQQLLITEGTTWGDAFNSMISLLLQVEQKSSGRL